MSDKIQGYVPIVYDPGNLLVCLIRAVYVIVMDSSFVEVLDYFFL